MRQSWELLVTFDYLYFSGYNTLERERGGKRESRLQQTIAKSSEMWQLEARKGSL